MTRVSSTSSRDCIAQPPADRRCKCAASFAIAALLTACGGGSGPSSDPAAGGLTIQSSSPAQGATGVERTVQPQLTLSAAVDPATVVLTHPAGPVEAAVAAQGTQVTVTPELRLLPATTYTVQVGQGPTLTFTTRDGAWSAAPTRLSAGGADAHGRHIAVDARGNAIAVWYQQDGAMRNIWASRYERATGWTAPFTIEQNAALADSPQVAMDAEGNAIAVWIQTHVGAPSLWASRFTPAGGWETPELLELMDGSAAVNPRIAMNASGQAVVAWHQQEAIANIYVNRYAPGAGWQGPQSIEAHPMDSLNPLVAVTPSGLAVVSWIQRDAGGQWDLLASSAAAGGAWSAPVPVEHDAANVASTDRDLVAAPDGSVVTAWRQLNGEYQCLAAFFRADSGWAQPQRLDSQPANCQDVRVAADAMGGAQFVWSQDFGGRAAIWSNHYARASGWGTATALTTGGEALEPAIAVDAVGNALAAWKQDRGDANHPAYASRRLAGGTWSTPVRLEPGTDATVDAAPVIAMDASGSAIVLWSQFDPVSASVNAVVSHFD
jgi:hypothetical protein